MQYNYSHDNDGAGYLLAQFGNSRPFSDNIVRYNLSEDDGRNNRYGGITMFASPGEWISRVLIHNNTAYADAGDAEPSGVRIEPGRYADIMPSNIVFVSAGGAVLVDAADIDGVRFEHNAYWSTEPGSFEIAWGDTAYSSLSSWRAAEHQEIADGESVGLVDDPLLRGIGDDVDPSIVGEQAFAPSRSHRSWTPAATCRSRPSATSEAIRSRLATVWTSAPSSSPSDRHQRLPPAEWSHSCK